MKHGALVSIIRQPERLTALIVALRDDADNPKGIQFDLGIWIMSSLGREPDIGCGTKACAVGLACLLPKFQEQGLRFDPVMKSPTFQGLSHWDAVESFFGLTHGEALYLFASHSYPIGLAEADGERHVASRMESVLLNL